MSDKIQKLVVQVYQIQTAMGMSSEIKTNIILTIDLKDIYSHKTKNLKVFYCYIHQLNYQKTTFTHYLED